MRRRRWLVGVLVVMLCVVGVSCQRAKAGARCRTTDWGDDGGAWVLRCVNGRWRPFITKSDAAKIILANRPTTSTTTTTSIPPPASPAEVRVREMAQQVFGPSYWGGQVLNVWWHVLPTDQMGGAAGRERCRWQTRTVNGQTTTIEIKSEVAIDETLALNGTDDELGDVIAHEGAHVIACFRWPETKAPPGFPNASDGAEPAEGFAECFARYMRGPNYVFAYGCPNDELPATATQAAVP